MANDYFTKTGNPASHSSGSSALIRSEFAAVETAFDKLPTLTGNALGLVRVNSGATAMETISPAQARAAQDKSLGLRNKMINGRFQIWQRATSSSTVGYSTADRWRCESAGGTTFTASRQTFPVGQTAVPHNPKYYFTHVVNSGGLATSYYQFKQAIEGVGTFAGKTVTLSFSANASTAMNISVRIAQVFGTGGAPSASVNSNVTTVALSTGWQRFEVSLAVPSISGKTLGSDGNDYLTIYFMLDAGSNYNGVSNSLGNQSGTFRFADIQLEEGEFATPIEQRPIALELALCQRYFVAHFGRLAGVSTSTSDASGRFSISFPTEMRTTPTVTVGAGSGNPTSLPFDGNVTIINGADYAATAIGITRHGIGTIVRTAGVAASNIFLLGGYTADAEFNN